MAVRAILQVPHAALRSVCAPVEQIDREVEDLARDMLESMYAATGRGLAAPQIGVLRRLFVMDATWKDGEATPRVFINPEVVWASEEMASCEEGCLSIPGDPVEVTRPAEVTLRWMALDGAACEETFDGFEAVCVQHETDHLDGILCTDKGAAA